MNQETITKYQTIAKRVLAFAIIILGLTMAHHVVMKDYPSKLKGECLKAMVPFQLPLNGQMSMVFIETDICEEQIKGGAEAAPQPAPEEDRKTYSL